MASPNKLIYEKEGVYIHTTVAKANEDALVEGKIFIWQRKEGVFIEWKSFEELENMTDWTVVDAVGYKQDSRMSESGSVTLKTTKAKPTSHKYVIDFDLRDLKSLKRSRPNLGWSYIIFILKDGTTYPALHFHRGGTKAFVKELEAFLLIKKSPSDSCLYLVREQDPQALSKSFDELQLFEEQAGHVLSKFINDPVTATMGGFSKVTNFLYDALLVPPESSHRPAKDVADILSEDIPGIKVNSQEETGFEMVTTRELPPRPEVTRDAPLSPQCWARHMDKDGRIKDVEGLKKIIFRGGVEPSLRTEVWKFLLGYYSWDSTHATRADQRKQKVDDYFRMKLQWKSISPDQEKRFSLIRDRKGLIDKDVLRTDRTHPYYKGDNNPNISMLYDILMTYCMYNFDLGYVQGMSDLLAPILVVMENEVDAFWCLAGFMELVGHNFEMSQEGIKSQLHQVNVLLRLVDPQLCNHLEGHESSNMYFCFRWLLILFKREFNFPDIMRLWEVVWTGLPCKNFHLIMCLAILDNEKTTLIENNFGFTEILKHINDITGTIELEPMLKKSEAIYLQMKACGDSLPEDIQSILGMDEPSSNTSTPDHEKAKSSASTPERALSSVDCSVARNKQMEKYRREKMMELLSAVYSEPGTRLKHIPEY